MSRRLMLILLAVFFTLTASLFTGCRHTVESADVGRVQYTVWKEGDSFGVEVRFLSKKGWRDEESHHQTRDGAREFIMQALDRLTRSDSLSAKAK